MVGPGAGLALTRPICESVYNLTSILRFLSAVLEIRDPVMA